MKFIQIAILLPILLVGCTHTDKSNSINESEFKVVSIPDNQLLFDQVFYDKSKSLWINKSDSSFVSGSIRDSYSNGSLSRKFDVFEGRKEGTQLTYFPSGQIKFSEEFRDNRLHGDVKRWTLNNGYHLIAHLKYQDGRLHGEQKKWYDTGELHKVLNLQSGKEEGMQKAFRKNGALYANYQALNGRIFGLKRSNLCYELDNEKVVYKQ